MEPKSGGKGHERSVQFGSRRGCSSDRRSDSHRHWFGPIGRATGAASASVYAPIVPCRLVDTRPAPDNVGAKSIPLRAAEVVTFAVSGTNGNCTIPTSATGIATNATAVHPTADSCITIYTADAVPRPTASNLNVVAESPPTPNQVTVGLSSAGAFGGGVPPQPEHARQPDRGEHGHRSRQRRCQASFFNHSSNFDLVAE